MATPRDETRPMAEPGKQRTGADTGGILANADGGLADALQRSSERRDDRAGGTAATGQGSAGGTEPRLDLGGKDEPGSAPGPSAPSRDAGSEEALPGSGRSRGGSPHVEREAPGRGSLDTIAPDGGDTVAPDGGGGTAAPDRGRDTAVREGSLSTGRSSAVTGRSATNPHDPDEPPDESPIESLGRAVSEVVTGAGGHEGGTGLRGDRNANRDSSDSGSSDTSNGRSPRDAAQRDT